VRGIEDVNLWNGLDVCSVEKGKKPITDLLQGVEMQTKGI
jgi:hypothetical protein